VEIPLVLHLGAASQVAPLVAAAVARRPVRGGRAWTLVWCAILLTIDLASLWLGRHSVSNIAIVNILSPACLAIVLWALSDWQHTELARLTLRVAIVPFLASWGVLTYALEDTSTFSRVADPLASLVGLGAAAFTLVARSYSATGSLLRQDWFWVCGGMVIYFGSAAMLQPLSALLLGSARELFVRAYEVKSVIDVFAFLAIARGVTCPAAT
jgi:hypothetical protein